MFTFGFFNGNTGREIAFDTKAEALLEAESRWSHLTEQEKKRYTEKAKQVILLHGTVGYHEDDIAGNFQVAWVPKSCIEPQEQLLHMIRDEVGSSGAQVVPRGINPEKVR